MNAVVETAATATTRVEPVALVTHLIRVGCSDMDQTRRVRRASIARRRIGRMMTHHEAPRSGRLSVCIRWYELHGQI